jgi:hypothetical protein
LVDWYLDELWVVH